MAVIFDPLTGQLINVSVTGGGGASSLAYVKEFLISDWSAPSGGDRTISIPHTEHAKGINPIIQVFEKNGSLYDDIGIVIEVDSTNGDVTLVIPNDIDLRFDGKAVIK